MSKAKEYLHQQLKIPFYKVIDYDRMNSNDNGDAQIKIATLINFIYEINHKTLEDVEKLINEKISELDTKDPYHTRAIIALKNVDHQLKTLKL